MTDAPGASSAVWPRPLLRSPPEKIRLRENGETTFGAVDRGPVSQSGQQETRGISPAASRHHHWKRVLGRCRCNGEFFGCWAGRNEASGEPVISPNPKWAMMGIG